MAPVERGRRGDLRRDAGDGDGARRVRALAPRGRPRGATGRDGALLPARVRTESLWPRSFRGHLVSRSSCLGHLARGRGAPVLAVFRARGARVRSRRPRGGGDARAEAARAHRPGRLFRRECSAAVPAPSLPDRGDGRAERPRAVVRRDDAFDRGRGGGERRDPQRESRVERRVERRVESRVERRVERRASRPKRRDVVPRLVRTDRSRRGR